jgi:chemotaxis protein methyltransferase CheR
MSGDAAYSVVPPELLQKLNAFVANRMGLHFSPQRLGELERGLRSAALELGFEDAAACAEWLISSDLSQPQVEILASHLTVGETYFFRERGGFAVLEERVLPQLIAARRGREQRLRIWSAACCTGEEPYSLAIVLRQLLPDLEDWDVTLLATDINPRFLRIAAEGVYGEWSFRNAPAGIKERYFTRMADGRYAILPRLRQLVRFDYLNLAENVYPSLFNDTNGMDLILCRNVLIYLAPEQAARWVRRLAKCLVEGGWILFGVTEIPHISTDISTDVGLSAVRFPGVVVHQLRSPERPLSETLPGGPESRSDTTVPIPLQAGSQAAVATDPTPAQIALLAREYANQGNLRLARVWCEKAIAADKGNAGFHYLRAMILQELGELAEAGVSLKRSISLDPDFIMAHFALGHLSRRKGETGERHFESVLRLLRGYGDEDTFLEAEGLTAGRLAEIVQSMTGKETTR